jgi:hypothetical protein
MLQRGFAQIGVCGKKHFSRSTDVVSLYVNTAVCVCLFDSFRVCAGALGKSLEDVDGLHLTADTERIFHTTSTAAAAAAAAAEEEEAGLGKGEGEWGEWGEAGGVPLVCVHLLLTRHVIKVKCV